LAPVTSYFPDSRSEVNAAPIWQAWRTLKPRPTIAEKILCNTIPNKPVRRPTHRADGFFTGIQFRSILTGAVVDFIASLFGCLLLWLLRCAKLRRRPLSKRKRRSTGATSEGLAAGLLLGLSVPDRRLLRRLQSRHLEMKHGALVGVASILLGLVTHSGDTETQFPEWFMALSFAADPGRRPGRILCRDVNERYRGGRGRFALARPAEELGTMLYERWLAKRHFYVVEFIGHRLATRFCAVPNIEAPSMIFCSSDCDRNDPVPSVVLGPRPACGATVRS
jgi:hypothetical protein